MSALKVSNPKPIHHNNYMNSNRNWMSSVDKNLYKPRTANSKFHKRCETLSVDRTPILQLSSKISDLRFSKSETGND